MDDPTDQDLAIQAILDVAGREGMKALRAAKGGTEVFIPAIVKPDHWMAQVFGLEKAVEIVRRLTVFGVDGRPTCSIRMYVSQSQTRFQELKALIAREITDALLSGMSNRAVALKVRVGEKYVNRQKTALIADGKLKALPRQPKALPAPASTPTSKPTRTSAPDPLWEIKRELVDEALLRGHGSRRITLSAGVGRTYIRMRRKVLLASGRLKPGRLSVALTP